MIRLFVGFDAREAVASSVFIHSAERLCTVPIQSQKLILSQLKPWFDRPRDPLQSTDFAFSRFLVPYLCGYEGWALFADGDMLCREDLARLWKLRDESKAVMVVQRAHHATQSTKFLGQKQTAYARKNWSSLMLFNCRRCTDLVPGYVANAPGLDLHQFRWVPDDLIGDLPARWNHLVGVDEPNEDAAIVHYTLGMPFFQGFERCEYATDWYAARDWMLVPS